MSITTVLVFIVARRHWRWGRVRTFLTLGLLLTIDLAFFAANLPKFIAGGWLPLTIAALVFTLMSTWKRGRTLLLERLRREDLPLSDFVLRIEAEGLPTVPGTAVYLAAHTDQVPHALLHSLKHFQCLHEQIVILHVTVLNEPFVSLEQQMVIESINARFSQARLCLGFMDTPNVIDAMQGCRNRGLSCDPERTTFILGRETLLSTPGAPMALWRQKLYIALLRNARDRADYFALPPNRVVELGARTSL